MYSYTEETASGETNVFPVPFPYLRRAHVTVLVDGVSQTFAWLTDNTIAVVGSAGDLTGRTVRVQRRTPGQDALVKWKTGGLDPDELTLSDTQLLYLFQEAFDAVLRSLNLSPDNRGFDFRGFRGINAGDPVLPQDVVTKVHMERRVLELFALVGTGDPGTNLDGLLRESLRVLPTVEPQGTGLPWVNGGVLSVTSGPLTIADPGALALFLQALPTEAPNAGGQPYLNGGVVCVTAGGGPVIPTAVSAFTTYMLGRPFMPVEPADVPLGGAWYRWGTAQSWVPNFVASA